MCQLYLICLSSVSSVQSSREDDLTCVHSLCDLRSCAVRFLRCPFLHMRSPGRSNEDDLTCPRSVTRVCAVRLLFHSTRACAIHSVCVWCHCIVSTRHGRYYRCWCWYWRNIGCFPLYRQVLLSAIVLP